MGMAASQARFLNLTARKSNVEFEGQQVNQQRTTLSNQSANYYNQLLGMKVPTPPSSEDFTKTVYSFVDGNLSNSITSMIAQSNGMYLVSYVSSWVNDYTPVSNGNAVVTQIIGTPNTYKIGSIDLRQLGVGSPNDPYLNSLSPAQRANALAEEGQYINMLNNKYGTPTNGWFVRYVQNSTTGVWAPQFYNADDVMGAAYDANGLSQSAIKSYTMGSERETQEIKGVQATFEKDSTGRYMKITLNPNTSSEVTYALTTNTTTDDAAFNDAMNQYEYEKYQYDHQIETINAKIEVVQAQDKNLELRLKQLDTEHNALQIEMEAIKKVIEQNVQKTFNLFQQG